MNPSASSSWISFRTTRRKRRSTGFSLLEVLIALAIVGMAAIALVGAYVNILISYDVAANQNASEADLIFARSLILNQADRKKVEEGGDFDDTQGQHVHWTAEIASTNEADLFTVTFTCEITDPKSVQHEPVKTTQTFTVLRPTWSTDQAEHDKLREDAKSRILELQGKQKT